MKGLSLLSLLIQVISQSINKFTQFYNQVYRMPSIQDESKKINKAPRGPPVKQFEWFQMETRLRKIIQQIIDPIQYEIVKNSSHIQKLEKNNSSFQDRIQYIMRMTTNDPEVFEKGVFKKIQDKFQAQQKTLTFLEEQVKNNTSFIDNKINLIDERMKQSNDMISQIQALKTSNRQNLKHQTQKFQTVRANIQQNVQKMSAAIEQNHQKSREKIEKLEKEIKAIFMRMQNVEKEFTVVKQYSGAQKDLNEDLIQQGIKLKEQNREIEGRVVQLDKKVKQLNKIKPFLQDIQTDYRKFMFKVDNIVPLINQAQINESLYRILPAKFHPRIAVYEFERYIELNEKVLTRHFELDSLGIQFNGQQLIRQSQERNTKLLTKLKRQYYKNNGVDLDFISFEERQRLLNDFDYPKLCQIVDQLEQLQNQKNDYKKNHKLTEQDIVNLLQKQLQHDKQILIHKIHQEIQDSKTYLLNSSEEHQKLISILQNKLNKLNSTLDSFININDLRNNQFQHSQTQINLKFLNCAEKINHLQGFGKQLVSYLENNSKRILKLSSLQKQFQGYGKFHQGVLNNKHHPKQSLYKEENLKTKLGVILKSDSNQNHSFPITLNQKQPNTQSPQNDVSNQDQRNLQIVKKLSLQFSVIKQTTYPEQTRLKSSFSKLTLPSNSELKHHSKSSYIASRKDLHFSQSNKSTEIHKTPQKTHIKGLLDIPEFKSGSSTRYCRESHTSRLSIRKKPSLNPARTQFIQQDQTINFKNNQVRNSLTYFSQLKKQNSRFLK